MGRVCKRTVHAHAPSCTYTKCHTHAYQCAACAHTFTLSNIPLHTDTHTHTHITAPALSNAHTHAHAPCRPRQGRSLMNNLIGKERYNKAVWEDCLLWSDQIHLAMISLVWTLLMISMDEYEIRFISTKLKHNFLHWRSIHRQPDPVKKLAHHSLQLFKWFLYCLVFWVGLVLVYCFTNCLYKETMLIVWLYQENKNKTVKYAESTTERVSLLIPMF